jgi:hypothetical protein
MHKLYDGYGEWNANASAVERSHVYNVLGTDAPSAINLHYTNLVQRYCIEER